MTSSRNDLKTAARQALQQLFEPLSGFMLQIGLGPYELSDILRQAAVRSVANQQLELSNRRNISGIAAATGINRSEVSRILRDKGRDNDTTYGHRRLVTDRVLASWHRDPKFTDVKGRPAELSLYGRGATFESLVKTHGRGIATRAVLDELLRSRAVDVLPFQKIRARTSRFVNRSITPQKIKMFGDRAGKLVSTMLANMREPDRSHFLGSMTWSVPKADLLPPVTRELSTKGAKFLTEIQERLPQEQARRLHTHRRIVTVAIYCHEAAAERRPLRKAPSKRRNFRRN